ncbi:hypothetical protein [Paenibacillus pinihumi]|uniref:hypothetical protein n=1 Tax=Paenibacillus pinihumi TaxID=669462 RepID=UPI0004153B58|nr:hypothetical protein [Paenibacillus pinihumi]
MTKQELITKLLALPAEITAAEDAVLGVHRQLTDVKDILQEKEDSLLLGNRLDGKNAEMRAAQARAFTGHERKLVTEYELRLKNAVSNLERLRVQMNAYRTVASLLQVNV